MAEARAVGVAQTVPARGDVTANLRQHVALIEAAAPLRPHILVFPELSLTGYELDLAAGLAFETNDARLHGLVARASQHRMTLIVGAPVRVGARLHIGAFVITPDGSIDVYTKRHLGAFPPSVNPDGPVPPAEGTVFVPGDLDPIVRLGDGTAAVAVCADIGRPSHPERAARRGARTYLASMFIIPSDLEGDTAKLQSYAARHQMVVAAANYGGPTGGLPAAGSSSIWSDRGELIVRLDTAGAAVAVATESGDGWRARTASLTGAEPV